MVFPSLYAFLEWGKCRKKKPTDEDEPNCVKYARKRLRNENLILQNALREMEVELPEFGNELEEL